MVYMIQWSGRSFSPTHILWQWVETFYLMNRESACVYIYIWALCTSFQLHDPNHILQKHNFFLLPKHRALSILLPIIFILYFFVTAFCNHWVQIKIKAKTLFSNGWHCNYFDFIPVCPVKSYILTKFLSFLKARFKKPKTHHVRDKNTFRLHFDFFFLRVRQDGGCNTNSDCRLHFNCVGSSRSLTNSQKTDAPKYHSPWASGRYLLKCCVTARKPENVFVPRQQQRSYTEAIQEPHRSYTIAIQMLYRNYSRAIQWQTTLARHP